MVSIGLVNIGPGGLVMVAPVTSAAYGLRSHVEVEPGTSGLGYVSRARCESAADRLHRAAHGPPRHHGPRGAERGRGEQYSPAVRHRHRPHRGRVGGIEVPARQGSLAAGEEVQDIEGHVGALCATDRDRRQDSVLREPDVVIVRR